MKNKANTYKSLFFKCLTFVLLLCVVFASVITSYAEAADIPTISKGEVWNDSWSSSVQSVSIRLDVDQTGLYHLLVMDHKKTALFLVYVNDITNGERLGYIAPQEITEIFMTAGILLVKDHVYELECYYYTYDKNSDDIIYADAELSVTFNRSNEGILEIPECDISSSSLQARFTDIDSYVWLKYKAAVDGDYSFNFTDMYAYVTVYDVLTGKIVYSNIDTMYYTDTAQKKDRLVFELKADTEYYIFVSSYDNSTTKLSITKNNKDVKDISINSVVYDIDCYWTIDDIDSSCFDYRVTYSDDTSNVFFYYDLCKMGYDIPDVNFLGGEVYINGVYYLKAGQQPVEYTYKGQTRTFYLYIKSLTDFFAYLEPVDENDDCVIKYEDDSLHTYWWHINMSNSGFYSIWRYNSDDFRTNFDRFSIVIVDENNNIVEYNKNNKAWPLVAGKDYVLGFKYRYNKEYSYNDIVFWLEMEDDLVGWKYVNDNWVYYENGTKLTNCWKLDSNGWCYLSDDGTMATNEWVLDSVGWCYVGSDGYCVTDCWMQDSYGWVYLDSDGRMVTDQWILDSVGWCYVGADGYCVTDRWVKDGYGWVYLDSDGRMVTNTWVMDSKGWCYVGPDGYAVANCWKKDSVGWCYLDSEGSMMKSEWLFDCNNWYYLDENGYMVTGDYIINDEMYSFDSDGIWIG